MAPPTRGPQLERGDPGRPSHHRALATVVALALATVVALAEVDTGTPNAAGRLQSDASPRQGDHPDVVPCGLPLPR